MIDVVDKKQIYNSVMIWKENASKIQIGIWILYYIYIDVSVEFWCLFHVSLCVFYVRMP